MRILLWLKKEIVHLLPVFVFFVVSFTVINWTETFLFEKAGIKPYSFVEVVLAAGIVAKVFLVIDHLPLIDLFKGKPLIYKIIWKTILYCIIILFVRVAIRFIPYLLSGEGFKGDFFSFNTDIDWGLFLSIQGYYLMLLFIFTTSRDLTQVIGVEKMRRIFFGR